MDFEYVLWGSYVGQCPLPTQPKSHSSQRWVPPTASLRVVGAIHTINFQTH